MNRSKWITNRLKINEERMDNLFSGIYDQHWNDIEEPHKKMIETLVGKLPPNPYILDSACGTGKYWEMLLKLNCRILGIDNSSGMLSQAKKKFPSIQTKKMKMHKIDFTKIFDAVICMDAMENIFPEHWPIVLKNYYKAIKDHGYIYFTVELENADKLQKNFEQSISEGIPVVLGELLENGGYHYYPKLEQVRIWIYESKLKIVAEEEGGVYHHFLTEKIP